MELEVLEDLFVTATEGGSNYWLGSVRIMIDAEKEALRNSGESVGECMARTIVNSPNAFIEVYDAEDDDELLGTITAKGLDKAFLENQDLYNTLVQGDYDAETTDVLIQEAIFGEVVYG